MSFILEDKKLVNALVRYGLSKKAQQNLGASPQDFAALRGILDNLSKEITTPGSSVIEGSQVSTESDQAANLTAPQLENLGTLVKFLADNQITLDGQRVAYPADANIQDPRYQLFKLEGAAGTLELARNNEAVKYGYRVDKNLLSKYLDSVRGQLAKEPNPVLNVLVQARIQDVNDQLDAGMGAEYKQPERTLVPTKIVDSLPANVKTQYPYEKGSLPLTYADITSDTAFNAWIQKNNIYVDDKQHDFPQYNKAGLLTVLSKRAEYDQGNASTQDAKDTATIYGAQVAKLAQMFHVTLGGGAKTTVPAAGTGTALVRLVLPR